MEDTKRQEKTMGDTNAWKTQKHMIQTQQKHRKQENKYNKQTKKNKKKNRKKNKNIERNKDRTKDIERYRVQNKKRKTKNI